MVGDFFRRQDFEEVRGFFRRIFEFWYIPLYVGTGVRLQQTTKSSDLNRTSASFSGQLPRTHTR